MATLKGQESKLWDFDLRHIGDLCQRVRQSRGLNPTDIATECQVKVETISRNIERKGRGWRKTFECYVKALQSQKINNKIVDQPLTALEAKMLIDLHENRQKKKLQALQCQLATVNFQDIKSENTKTLLTLLKQSDYPACIIDPFWFVHAMNRAAYHLFSINPDSSKLTNHWSGWHLIGASLGPNPQVRDAHRETDRYKATTIHAFFHDPLTYKFLFTFQMRMLIYKLHNLSLHHSPEFSKWWLQASRFTLPFESGALTRTILYKDQKIRIEGVFFQDYAISIPFTKHQMTYRLVGWAPNDEPARKAFEDVQRQPDSKNIYYAADYDKDHKFHVNTWPEVKLKIGEWEKKGWCEGS